MEINIGINIKRIRLQRMWGQDFMARELKISVPAYSKIETGQTTVNISRLIQISEVFETEVTRLIYYDGSEDTKLISPAEFKSLKDELIQNRIELNQLRTKIIELYGGLN